MPDGMPVAGMRGAVARLSPRVWTALLSGLAAVLLLVPAMLAWGVLVTGAEHLFATRPTRLAEDLAWLPPAVAVLWGALVLYGIAPMSLAQYLICRRCLRRRPSFTEGEIR